DHLKRIREPPRERRPRGARRRYDRNHRAGIAAAFRGSASTDAADDCDLRSGQLLAPYLRLVTMSRRMARHTGDRTHARALRAELWTRGGDRSCVRTTP